MKSRVPSTLKLSALRLVIAINSGSLKAEISQDTLNSTSTPNAVQSSIGTLQFVDGAPLPETAEKDYDYLDTARAMDSFLKGMPGASVMSATRHKGQPRRLSAHSLGFQGREVECRLTGERMGPPGSGVLVGDCIVFGPTDGREISLGDRLIERGFARPCAQPQAVIAIWPPVFDCQ